MTQVGIRIFFRNVDTKDILTTNIRKIKCASNHYSHSLSRRSQLKVSSDFNGKLKRKSSPTLLTQVESLKFVEKLYILNREFRSSYFENNSYQVVV